MKEPVRTCVGCRALRGQSELVRVVRAVDAGGVWVDPGPPSRARPAGRGAYVCPDPECVDRAVRTGALKRALRLVGPLPEEIRAELARRAAAG